MFVMYLHLIDPWAPTDSDIVDAVAETALLTNVHNALTRITCVIEELLGTIKAALPPVVQQ